MKNCFALWIFFSHFFLARSISSKPSKSTRALKMNQRKYNNLGYFFFVFNLLNKTNGLQRLGFLFLVCVHWTEIMNAPMSISISVFCFGECMNVCFHWYEANRRIDIKSMSHECILCNRYMSFSFIIACIEASE